ncbi:MAG: hypothetical protein AAGJ83_08060 [Planctomycetota bacterium]
MSVTKDEALLKGEDLLIEGEYRRFTLTIGTAALVDHETEDGKQRGLMLHFTKAKKPLFCPIDKLNHRLLKAELGTNVPEEIQGKQITVIPVSGNWFGQSNVLAVRILVTGDKPKPMVSKRSFGWPVEGLRPEIVNAEAKKK